ncbi:relaxase/mobilization nuclease domain-containing protein [Nitrosospira multiformis]
MHDKDATSAERVAWWETGNLLTNDPKEAAKVMAYTDMNSEQLKRDNQGSLAGRQATAGAVYHYSLSWAHGENPNPEQQKTEAKATLEQLGLDKHQYLMVAHNDTQHAHLHIVVNLTDQETGKRNIPSYDKRELQSWALEYERTHGIYCDQRVENVHKREQGNPTKYRDEKQSYAGRVTEAYKQADSGKAFAAALETHGLTLAQGRRGGLVIVDMQGDIQKLARQIDGASTKEIKARLSDLDIDSLPLANELAKKRQETTLPEQAEPQAQATPPASAVRQPANIYEYKEAIQGNNNPPPASLNEFSSMVTKTMQENNGELHMNDGLTWWQRPVVSQAMRDWAIETAKEILDMAKDKWQEFVRRFDTGPENHERDGHERER